MNSEVKYGLQGIRVRLNLLLNMTRIPFKTNAKGLPE